ncbi:transcriptional repressor LexA [Pseudolysobacter antarcticus]|uniref:LexA repressor n=2 Tax=Pseudolysobacter antarcticus TaxID=2511995 RepID=A0A411HQ22_9GAMM|nr:transcriptional repressor LexA [Pseudolysobacter antarcticus]
MGGMDNLTDKQQAILDFIRSTIAANGYPPSNAEIADAFGLRERATVRQHLQALQTKGAIEISPGIARGLRLVEAANTSSISERSDYLELPLVGRVAAGLPITADANLEGHFTIDRAFFHPRPHFLLRVEGQSMRDIGILDGDFIAVHRSPVAEEGQVVVARIEDEITVKRFRRRGSKILLLPENPDYQPITVDPAREDFAIEGLYVGVIRRS